MQFLERRIIQFTLQILLLCLLQSLPATFAGFVTNTNDTGPGSLRFAVENAASGEIVTFDTSMSGKRIILVQSSIALAKDLQIDASALPEFVTIVHGLDYNNIIADRIFFVQTNCTVTLNHLEIAEGWIYTGRGAGILNRGNLTLTNCSVTRNELDSSEGGAGICNARGASLTVLSSSVSGNAGYGAPGCGIFNEPGGAIFLSRSAISNSSGNGAGIYNDAGATADVIDCTFSTNDGGSGGAIYNASGNGALATLRLTRCLFTRNRSFSGGAIFNSGSMQANTCTFSGNAGGDGASGPTTGGAIANSGGSAAFYDCLFQGNGAGDGGAILSSGGAVVLNRCALLANNASLYYGSGGAIQSLNSSLSITNCTFFANAAGGHAVETPDPDHQRYYGYEGYGGAINCFGGSLSLESCTVVGNSGGARTPDSGAITLSWFTQPDFPPVSASIHNSIVTSNLVNGAFATNNIFGAYSGSHNLINADPKLGPLGNYGGPTPTIPLLADSPAIDAAEATPLVTDQRGFPRRAGPAQDIGAFEFNSILPPPPTITVTLKAPSNLEINFDSIPGVLFTILAADQLTPPDPQWQTLGIASEQNGHYTFLAPLTSSTPRFFQVRFQ